MLWRTPKTRTVGRNASGFFFFKLIFWQKELWLILFANHNMVRSADRHVSMSHYYPSAIFSFTMRNTDELCIPFTKTNAILCRFIIFRPYFLYTEIWPFGFSIQASMVLLLSLLLVAIFVFSFVRSTSSLCARYICFKTYSIFYYWIRKITEIKAEVAKNVTWKCLLSYRIQ